MFYLANIMREVCPQLVNCYANVGDFGINVLFGARRDLESMAAIILSRIGSCNCWMRLESRFSKIC